jgi:peptidoglycan/LPS O-acetylase OafA/YrhL
MLGKYSYALYLCHLPLRALIRDIFYGPLRAAGSSKPTFLFTKLLGSQIPGQLLYYVMASAISAGISKTARSVGWSVSS